MWPNSWKDPSGKGRINRQPEDVTAMKWHDKRANTVDFAETAETGKTDKQEGTPGQSRKLS